MFYSAKLYRLNVIKTSREKICALKISLQKPELEYIDSL